MNIKIRQAKLFPTAAVMLLAGTVFVSDVAFGQSQGGGNPHFNRCSLSLDTETATVGTGRNRTTVVTGATLEAAFKEVGLGNNQLINYLLEADATAEWACINNGGNFPQDPKKQTVEGPVTAEGAFASGKNGQVTATLRVDAPDRDPSPCRGNQTDVLLNVSFNSNGVTVTDTTNDVEINCGSISRTFLTLP